jgi:hypothetical protein
LKTKDIENALAKFHLEKKHNPVCTNFKGAGYAECDLISISGSDYIYEFEVKISRGDFKKDAEKHFKHKYLNESYQTKVQKKRRTKKVSKVPNYFSYVCPTDMIKEEEIPLYAGLIYVDEDLNFTVIKKAPKVHSDKADMKLIKRIALTLSERLAFGMAMKSYHIKQLKAKYNERKK